jgi:hypothetical protein
MKKEEDFYQQTVLVWGGLQGAQAQATLVKVMKMMDSSMDITEANSSKMKVSRFGKKVELKKLFEMAPSKNSNVPWHVATVWLSLHGTTEEKSIANTWMIVDPLMTNEYASRSTKKVTRLVEGLDFFKICPCLESSSGHPDQSIRGQNNDDIGPCNGHSSRSQ